MFNDVYVDSMAEFGELSVYEREGVEPNLSDRRPPGAAACQYRVLQNVFQENPLPRRTRESYVLEKDARRSLAWSVGDYPRAVAYSACRRVMLYGSSPWRILVTSTVVIVVFAALFPLTGGIDEVNADRAVTYTVQDPEAAPPW